MERYIAVIQTENPPSDGVVVHNLREAAQAIVDEQMREMLSGLDVPVIFRNPTEYEAEINRVHDWLVQGCKAPIAEINKPASRPLAQLSFKF